MFEELEKGKEKLLSQRDEYSSEGRKKKQKEEKNNEVKLTVNHPFILLKG